MSAMTTSDMFDLGAQEIDAVSGGMNQDTSDNIGKGIVVAGIVTADPALFLLGVLWLITPA